ncbi:MAG: lysozyme inhibitor LprI family protein [Methylobacter sp.]|nr:lysozyme inhibitor LprI family protein [Methylobacter sp.]
MSKYNKRKAWLVATLLSCLIPVPSAQAVSFDCAKAQTKVEKLICGNEQASQLDKEMQSAYQEAQAQEADPVSLKTEQRQWLKMRDTCNDVACIIQVYRTRLASLKAMLTEPKACFRLLERKWPEVASGHYPVCVDFLKNLNSFCDATPVTNWIKSPTGGKIMVSVYSKPELICEWKINPAVNTVSTPQWDAIDPKTHLKIIQNMQQHYYHDPEEKWQPIPPDMLQRINEGQSRLWHTWIDLDHDGQKEHVVRFDDLPCGRSDRPYFLGLPTYFAVVDDEITKVNVSYEYLNNVMGIVVHNGQAYVITGGTGSQKIFDSGLAGFRNSLDLQEPFSVPETGGKGMTSVCIFDYIK